MEQDHVFRRDEPLSGNRPRRGTALLLAAHGERRAGSANDGLSRLAARLRARRLAGATGFGLVKGAPSIGEAVRACDAGELIVYPLFLSDGYFARVRLPQLLAEAASDLPALKLHVLPPLGLAPGLASLIADAMAHAARRNGFDPSETGLVLLGHGSKTDWASAAATARLRQGVLERNRFAEVRVALLEGGPSLRQAVGGLAGPVLVFGLFVGDGLHGAEDVPRLVGELGRHDIVAAGTIGNLDGIDDLIADAVEGVAGRSRVRLGCR
jgi:sirohydrochlorin ferrochelatase